MLTEGATGPHGWSRGTDNTTAGANLAAAIRRHPALGGLYTATAAGNVVTLTGKIHGRPLNNLLVTTNDATAFTIVQPVGGADAAGGIFLNHIWTGRR